MQLVRSSNCLLIARSPPVAEIPVGIELAALIVETVRQLVPDYGADSAKVQGIVGLVVEKWRLQNAGGNVMLFSLSL